jgi:aryl-alcohol dehydrogenase-like predicted oxidoreductase
VFTKASLVPGPGGRVVNNLKRNSILREAGDSLERLGVDAIDLYQVHWPIPEEDLEEGWVGLRRTEGAGTRASHRRVELHRRQLRRVEQIAPVETLQPPYSLVAREIERELLPFAEREQIGVIVYSPMGSGLLTGAMTRARIERLPEDDWRKHNERFQEPQLSPHLALVERLQVIADCHDTTAGAVAVAVAVAWTLRNPAVDGAIVGFRHPGQVEPIVSAAHLELETTTSRTSN